jgi:muramoyltetrapeptide carboxypeptidase
VDARRLALGLESLRNLGYQPVEAANLGNREGFLAGTDEERLEAFHQLAADPDLRAIFFARGGYGLARLLPEIDWRLLARYPRAYVGYSDLTPFLLQVVERLGLVSFHGPMVAADLARGLEARERRSLVDALEGRFPQTIHLVGCEEGPPVEGPILGGCLSLLVSMLGTPFSADLEGALLFVEDVDEPPYRFDRMLTHLRLSGTLAGLKGLIVGHLTHRQAAQDRMHGNLRRDGSARHEVSQPVVRMDGALGPLMEDLAARFDWPLAWGLEVGHESPNLTLPLGMSARLEPEQRRLILNPSAGSR